jgi:hypothetical protein
MEALEGVLEMFYIRTQHMIATVYTYYCIGTYCSIRDTV